ncbi:hypothetical protein [Altererythrobacter sp. MF3-039]|uniref:hypothetical protein n=1 Tax=Altererythrobacter sp. MF3-039 TaxID=3252901 RepID=UPI00390CAF05
MAVKFDANRAWSKAMNMLSSNRQVVLIIAGVFFFLPNFALSLLAPEIANPLAETTPAETPDEAMAQLSSLGAGFFAGLVGLALIQAVGVLGLLRLLTDSNRPTVGEALRGGLAGLLPYVLAQIIQAFIFMFAVGLPFGLLAATGNPAAATFGFGLALALGIFLFVRFALLSPVIAIERIHSPFAALGRSWKLTRGKVGSLILFFGLLFIAVIIVMTVLTILLGLVFAAIGGQTQLIGAAFLGSIANAIVVTLFMAVLAAVHQQLAAQAET